MNTRRRILTNTKSGGNGVTYKIESVDLPLAFDGQNTSGYLPYIGEEGWVMRIWYEVTYTDNNNATLTLDYTYSGRNGEARSNTPITVELKYSYGLISFNSAASIAQGGPGAIFSKDPENTVIRLFYKTIGSAASNVAYDINLIVAN